MNDIIEIIKIAIKEDNSSINVDELDIEKSLTEQGVDSLDLYNIFLAVEEKAGIKIPDEKLETLRTISELATYIKDNK